MVAAASPSQIATAVRARAIALSRAELPLFLGLMGLLLALWSVVLIALCLGLGGGRLGIAGTDAALIACAMPTRVAAPAERESRPPPRLSGPV